ncbi:MAG: cobyric acid synthase, partial [Opitutales bacterium]|nr:cobyric acid synthase [Opitutales bacterium]
LPYLGALPMIRDLQPENEDSLSHPSPDRNTDSADQAKIAWIRFPRLSNSSDCQPWETDGGVCVQWVDHPEALRNAAAIILPGTKDTLADLNWLKQSGLADAITRKASEGTPVVGICGGFQMLGERLIDAAGVAGTPGDTTGLGLLPVTTVFHKDKHIEQVHAHFGNSSWTCYEIHNGRTHFPAGMDPLFQIERSGGLEPEGVRLGKFWGSYLHGMFESAEVRLALASSAGIRSYRTGVEDWPSHKRELHDKMADVLESHLNLEPILRYVEG